MDEAHKATTLALRCLSTESKFRPNMDEVVTTLEQLQVATANGGNQSPLVNGSRCRARRKSADDASSKKTAAAYPRPSASPLYA